MSNVKVNHRVLKQDFDHSYALSTEPVAVCDPVNVAIYGPSVEEGVHDGVTGEDAEAGTEDATGTKCRSFTAIYSRASLAYL